MRSVMRSADRLLRGIAGDPRRNGFDRSCSRTGFQGAAPLLPKSFEAESDSHCECAKLRNPQGNRMHTGRKIRPVQVCWNEAEFYADNRSWSGTFRIRTESG